MDDSKLELNFDCDLSLFEASLADKFVHLKADSRTQHFVESCRRKPHGIALTMAHRTLTRFFSDFDVNGALGAYDMHLLSTAQWQALLQAAPGCRRQGGHLLDVGAGDGNVTSELAALFDRVSATETSRSMVRRLRARGYKAHRRDIAHEPIGGEIYDAVALLNVLDRCASPMALLESAGRSLATGGVMLLALALPYRPLFYAGARATSPMRPLSLNPEQGWEASVARLISEVLVPADYEVVRFSRAPYLSRGDAQQNLYVLDDVIVVARRRSN